MLGFSSCSHLLFYPSLHLSVRTKTLLHIHNKYCHAIHSIIITDEHFSSYKNSCILYLRTNKWLIRRCFRFALAFAKKFLHFGQYFHSLKNIFPPRVSCPVEILRIPETSKILAGVPMQGSVSAVAVNFGLCQSQKFLPSLK